MRLRKGIIGKVASVLLLSMLQSCRVLCQERKRPCDEAFRFPVRGAKWYNSTYYIMEFLDPKAERRHRILLLIGYGLIAIAIGFASLIMLYYSYGYSLGSKGQVEQNGLVFFSSTPDGATVTLNGERKSEQTNLRLTLQSGEYSVKFDKDGYRSWSHSLTVQGGDVQRLDYAMLFPKELKTTQVTSFTARPVFASQSPDRRWLVIRPDDTDSPRLFTIYDLKNPEKPVRQDLTVADGIATAGNGTENWVPIGWANDNRHILLRHTYMLNGTESHEYIMLDRTDGTLAVNLTSKFSLAAADELTLFDQKYDKFYAYNSETKILRSFDSDSKTLVDAVERVRAYKTYGSDTILYVAELSPTDKQATEVVNVVLRQGSKRVVLRRLPASATSYPLNLATYGGIWYVAVGANTLKGVYLYRDPLDQQVTGNSFPKPWRFLAVMSPTQVAFSSNTRFILVANGQTCAVYDAENVTTHRFTLARAIDAPQTGAQWMDGYRLSYISSGKLTTVDFDNQNVQQLQNASPNYAPFFSADYEYVFSLGAADEAGTVKFESTSLLVTKQ